MKRLKKINLSSLADDELSRRTQRMIVGGKECRCKTICNGSCGCKYAGSQQGPDDSFFGGSGTVDNSNANADQNAATSVGALGQTIFEG